MNSLELYLEKYFLLKHPFYQAWNDGNLSINILQKYATEYYHHVAAFPRYISQIHSLCNDLKSRQVLLANLIDEESGEDNHPELWLRFAEGIGVNRNKMSIEPELYETQKLVNGYFDLVKHSYACGLGALYAYEKQTPEISTSKIHGLKQHYGVHDEKSLKFFTLHESVDKWHTEALETLIAKLNTEEKYDFDSGAKSGAKLLWNFLSGINQIAHANYC